MKSTSFLVWFALVEVPTSAGLADDGAAVLADEGEVVDLHRDPAAFAGEARDAHLDEGHVDTSRVLYDFVVIFY